MTAFQKQVQNYKWTVASHSVGLVGEQDFEWVKEDVADIGAGQVLIRNRYLSLDPTNRVWMGEKDTYMPALKIGEVMRGLAIGVVEESNHPTLREGDQVYGLLGWQKYLVSNGEGLTVLPNIPNLPLTAHFGLLGHIGIAAHYGMLHIGKPQPGETVVVSAAAGAVGSLAGQIAKIKGCRVIGIAGSDEKCAWLTQLGFDAAINYKAQSVSEALKTHCPKGIDVYFDNVGGKTLDAVLEIMNDYGRIVASGMISAYNETDPIFTSRHMVHIVTRRLLMQGFVCLDHPDYIPEAYNDLITWYTAGKLHYRLDVVEGLEKAPTALTKLFNGSNQGKLIVQVS